MILRYPYLFPFIDFGGETMATRGNFNFRLLILTIIGILLFTACTNTEEEILIPTPTKIPPSSTPSPTRTAALTATTIPAITATPTSLWSGLLLDMPLPFTTPLPAEEWTPMAPTPNLTRPIHSGGLADVAQITVPVVEFGSCNSTKALCASIMM